MQSWDLAWPRLNVSERRQQSPAVAVSTVAFYLGQDPREFSSPVVLGEQNRSVAPNLAGTPELFTESRQVLDTPQLWIPLVRRVRQPFEGMWALPGGPTQWDKTLTDTAHDTLVAATHATPNYLEQLYAFGSVERSAQAERTVTIAYWAQYRTEDLLEHPILGEGVAWFGIDRLPALAFDHGEIVQRGIERLRKRTERALVAHRFLPEEFTLAQLREVTQTILARDLDGPNFRRQILASGELAETGRMSAGGAHRPAKLYRYVGARPLVDV